MIRPRHPYVHDLRLARIAVSVPDDIVHEATSRGLDGTSLPLLVIQESIDASALDTWRTTVGAHRRPWIRTTVPSPSGRLHHTDFPSTLPADVAGANMEDGT